MTRGQKQAFTGGILLAGAGLFWNSFSAPEPRAPAVKTGFPQSPAFFSAAAAREKPPLSAAEFGTRGFRGDMQRRGAAWLAARNRDGAALVAMRDLTGDESLLDEAAKKYPNDPLVCAAMIARLEGGPEALPWAERLIASEPANPAGWYWKARALALMKDREQALAALKTAVTIKGKPEIHLRDRAMNVREAALAAGVTARHAAILGLSVSLARTTPHPLAGPGSCMLRAGVMNAEADGDMDQAAELSALAAACAEHFGFGTASTIADEFTRISTLREMLKHLPADTPYGEDGKTAAGRMTELTGESDRLREMKRHYAGWSFEKSMPDLSDARVLEFTDRYLLHGGVAAFQWLQTENPGN